METRHSGRFWDGAAAWAPDGGAGRGF